MIILRCYCYCYCQRNITYVLLYFCVYMRLNSKQKILKNKQIDEKIDNLFKTSDDLL